MNNHVKGNIFIILGALTIIFLGGELIFRILGILAGLYLIHEGLRLKNKLNVMTFFINRFDRYR